MTATAAPTVTTPAAKRTAAELKAIAKRWLFNLSLVVPTMIAATALSAVGTIMAASPGNVTDWASFWLGLAGVFVVLMVIGIEVLVSHRVTQTWPGALIGIVVLVTAIILASAWRPFINFNGQSFVLGLMELVFFAIVVGLGLAIGKFYRKSPTTT